jgi:hypothetical protein
MARRKTQKSWMKVTLAVLSLALPTGCDKHSGSYSLIGQSQSFVQPNATYTTSKIDILWVIDNSLSMQTSQANLAANFKAFITQFQSLNLDYHMAVTTTDAYQADPWFQNDPNAQYYPANAQYSATIAQFKDGSTGAYGLGHSGQFVLTPANTTPTIFSQNVSMSTEGNGDERAFSSFMTSLNDATNIKSGFRRSDAYLAIIIVSDEDDFSGQATFADHFYQMYATNYVGDHNFAVAAPELQPVSYYVSALDTYVGDHTRYSVNSIYADSASCVTTLNQSAPSSSRIVAQRYPALSAATSGVSASLCGDFSKILGNLSKTVIELASVFPLSRPADPTTFNITINGKAVPQDATNGYTYVVTLPGGTPTVVTSVAGVTASTYPKGTTYAVAFHGTAVPPSGAAINVAFTPATITNN